VFDTSALTASAAIFDTLADLDDKGRGTAPKLALSWDHSEIQDLDPPQAAARRQIHDGTPFNAEAVKPISTAEGSGHKCRCAF